MGRPIHRKLRLGLIVALSLLLLAAIGLTVRWFKEPAEKETAVPVYTCTQQVQLDYRVAFMPNNFFDEASAGPGLAYITSLTNHVETVLNYNFSGERPVNISGQYQVEATLTGYILQERSSDAKDAKREKIKVWSKPWVIVPSTPFSAVDQKLELRQIVPVDIRFYQYFAEQVAQELRFSADLVELTVTYHVQGGAITPQGEIREPVKAVMVIPIGGTAFMVQTLQGDKKEASITQSEIAPVAGVKLARSAYAATVLVLVLLLLLVHFKTTGEIVDLETGKLHKIMKKHGDRIVAGFGWVPALSEKNLITLNSFEDLVKVADEIAQPILYKENPAGVHGFYVVKEPLIYHFALKIYGSKGLFSNKGLINPEHTVT